MDSIANVTCEVNLINISFLVIQFVLDVLVLANVPCGEFNQYFFLVIQFVLDMLFLDVC